MATAVQEDTEKRAEAPVTSSSESVDVKEDLWSRQEAKSLPSIPTLHRVIGMTLDCYLAWGFCVIVGLVGCM